jgi:hypothetical protein
VLGKACRYRRGLGGHDLEVGIGGDGEVRMVGRVSLIVENRHNPVQAAEKEIKVLGLQRQYGLRLTLALIRETVGMYHGPDIGATDLGYMRYLGGKSWLEVALLIEGLAQIICSIWHVEPRNLLRYAVRGQAFSENPQLRGAGRDYRSTVKPRYKNVENSRHYEEYTETF